MYVNPFWMGVFLTVFAEIVFCIAVGIIANIKNSKGDK